MRECFFSSLPFFFFRAFIICFNVPALAIKNLRYTLFVCYLIVFYFSFLYMIDFKLNLLN